MAPRVDDCEAANLNKLVERALKHGFSHASLLDASTLAVRSEVRDMCRADKCHRYGKSWMCPPNCGALEDNELRVRKYEFGLIVQTTGELEDDFDYESMKDADLRQKRLFASFRAELTADYPGLLPLGNGTCEICEKCACPDSACRFPEKAISSMEAFGLVVSDVCEKNGLAYYYGPKTITYTGCYLLR
jgi:predicted metal-binding protein